LEIPLEIRLDDVTGPETIRFLEQHLEDMHRITPPGSVHALGALALRAADITLWSVWDGDELVGCGALRALDVASGEIKAMRTAPARRGSGIGSRILDHILAEARRRGYRHLYLETGASGDFAAARSLYTRAGFGICGPFGDYAPDPNSVFMQKAL
jgi:putative acetyltransferase